MAFVLDLHLFKGDMLARCRVVELVGDLCLFDIAVIVMILVFEYLTIGSINNNDFLLLSAGHGYKKHVTALSASRRHSVNVNLVLTLSEHGDRHHFGEELQKITSRTVHLDARSKT